MGETSVLEAEKNPVPGEESLETGTGSVRG